MSNSNAADNKTKQRKTLKPNTVAVQSTDDEIPTPSRLTAAGKVWYEAFVSWYKKHLSPQLDPDNIPNIIPRTHTESIFLNYLQFHDKYLGGRSSFEDREIHKRLYPNKPCVFGTDKEIHSMAYMFMSYGPPYFINNTDVKGKTKPELEYLKTKPWIKRVTTENEAGHPNLPGKCTITFVDPRYHHLKPSRPYPTGTDSDAE